MAVDIPIRCILGIHPPYKPHYPDIPAPDDSVFKVDATGRLRPRPCVVTDSLLERAGWVKICSVGQPICTDGSYIHPSQVFSFNKRGIESSNIPKEE
jgi:hypothetical protein